MIFLIFLELKTLTGVHTRGTEILQTLNYSLRANSYLRSERRKKNLSQFSFTPMKYSTLQYYKKWWKILVQKRPGKKAEKMNCRHQRKQTWRWNSFFFLEKVNSLLVFKFQVNIISHRTIIFCVGGGKICFSFNIFSLKVFIFNA